MFTLTKEKSKSVSKFFFSCQLGLDNQIEALCWSVHVTMTIIGTPVFFPLSFRYDIQLYLGNTALWSEYQCRFITIVWPVVIFLDALREFFFAPTDAIHTGFQSIWVLNMTKIPGSADPSGSFILYRHTLLICWVFNCVGSLGFLLLLPLFPLTSFGPQSCFTCTSYHRITYFVVTPWAKHP